MTFTRRWSVTSRRRWRRRSVTSRWRRRRSVTSARRRWWRSVIVVITVAVVAMFIASEDVVTDSRPLAHILHLSGLRVQIHGGRGASCILSAEKQQTCGGGDQKFFHGVHAPFDVMSSYAVAEILLSFAGNVNRTAPCTSRENFCYSLSAVKAASSRSSRRIFASMSGIFFNAA